MTSEIVIENFVASTAHRVHLVVHLLTLGKTEKDLSTVAKTTNQIASPRPPIPSFLPLSPSSAPSTTPGWCSWRGWKLRRSPLASAAAATALLSEGETRATKAKMRDVSTRDAATDTHTPGVKGVSTEEGDVRDPSS